MCKDIYRFFCLKQKMQKEKEKVERKERNKPNSPPWGNVQLLTTPWYRGDLRDTGSIPESGRSLEEGTAIHSSTLAWRNPWTEEPGGLQFVGRKESDMTERQNTYYDKPKWNRMTKGAQHSMVQKPRQYWR